MINVHENYVAELRSNLRLLDLQSDGLLAALGSPTGYVYSCMAVTKKEKHISVFAIVLYIYHFCCERLMYMHLYDSGMTLRYHVQNWTNWSRQLWRWKECTGPG